MVERLAVAKAAAVAGSHRDDTVCILACDTTVVLEGEAYGKPATRAEAIDMLTRLSGRAHDVITGLAVTVRSLEVEVTAREITRVTFRTLGDDEIAGYVESGEPNGKAGAYAIQGGAGRFVAALDGLRSNVIGLPVEAVMPLLATVGVRPQ
jgi:septum formation protein